MKSFQEYLTEADVGLRGELEKNVFGKASYNPEQEAAIASVEKIIMHAAENNMSRLMTMLKTLSSNDPIMKAEYEKIDFASLRSAAKKDTGIDNTLGDDNNIKSNIADQMP